MNRDLTKIKEIEKYNKEKKDENLKLENLNKMIKEQEKLLKVLNEKKLDLEKSLRRKEMERNEKSYREKKLIERNEIKKKNRNFLYITNLEDVKNINIEKEKNLDKKLNEEKLLRIKRINTNKEKKDKLNNKLGKKEKSLEVNKEKSLEVNKENHKNLNNNSNNFNWTLYLTLNKDLIPRIKSKNEAWKHYITHGKNENRIIMTKDRYEFDWKSYLNTNEDLKNITNEKSAWDHWVKYGKKENRKMYGEERNSFNWISYIQNNSDLNMLDNERSAWEHWINFGKKENRKINKETNITDCYKIINELNIKKVFVAHLHCLNIENFIEYYGDYLENILKYFQVIVTYCFGENLPNMDNIIFLKIFNKGMDVGAKMICINYLKRKNINYDFILMLHSKSNKYKRKLYFDSILYNIGNVMRNINKSYGIYTFDILFRCNQVFNINSDCKVFKDWGRNKYHMNKIIDIMNLPNFNFLFPEGNCYILNSDVAKFIYDDRFNLYKSLNDNNSFDYSWFCSYYNLNKISYCDAYLKYKKEKLFGNNLSTGKGWKGLADSMIEHTFERIPFGVCKLLNLKINILQYNDDENRSFNNFIFNNLSYWKKPVTVIACHSNNEVKIKCLLNNLEYFSKISDIIHIIDSNNFIGVIEKEIKNDKFIINNELNEKQQILYKNKYADLKGNENVDICKHYKIFGVNECRKIPNTVNVNFSYIKNNKLSGQIKWYDCLNKIKNKYENFIITNDSFILINSLVPFINYCKTSNKELIGLLDSYEQKYHYPDFLRYYNRTGINKWLNFFERIKDKIDCQYDLIKKIEIESTFITNSKECFYKMDQNFKKNLHFVDIVNKYFINKMKYPVIKIKKINFTKYESNDLPADFNHLEYRSLHNDLSNMNRNQLIDHFLNAGIFEGRTYKKNQKNKMPDYIRSKIKGILNI